MVDTQKPSITTGTVTNLMLSGLLTVASATTVDEVPVDTPQTVLLSDQLRPWECPLAPSGVHGHIDAESWKAVLTQFATRMLEDTIDPVPEFDAIISEHFWDLA